MANKFTHTKPDGSTYSKCQTTMKINYVKSHKHERYENGTLDFEAFTTNECGRHTTNYFVAQFYAWSNEEKTQGFLAYRLDLNGKEVGNRCTTIEQAKAEALRLYNNTDKICLTPVEDIYQCDIQIW